MFIFTLQDIVVLLSLGIIIIFTIILGIKTAIKQKFCKHANFFENGSCDAICRSCGKNLGFIGRLKEKIK